MKITILGRKVNLKDNFKERVEKKLSKFERIFSENSEAVVTVTVEKNRQIVEVTINDGGMVYRGEETRPEMNDALDAVIDVLGGQIRKNKTKLSKKMREGVLDSFDYQPVIENEEESFAELLESSYHVVRTKRFELRPMDVEEAILQMNMVGHQFFMFLNAETGVVSVVYLRHDGTYGMLEPIVD